MSHPKAVSDLAHWLVDNTASLYSVNRLTGYLQSVGHKVPKAAASEYLDWFEDAYFLFKVRIFDASLACSNANPKKVYCVDHAIVSSCSSGILLNSGRLLENPDLRTDPCDELSGSVVGDDGGARFPGAPWPGRSPPPLYCIRIGSIWSAGSAHNSNNAKVQPPFQRKCGQVMVRTPEKRDHARATTSAPYIGRSGHSPSREFRNSNGRPGTVRAAPEVGSSLRAASSIWVTAASR